MSFIESLARKGIEILEGVGKGVQFVGTRTGVVPVQWPHDKRPGLVWRIPESDDIPAFERVTAASIFAKKQPVLVREFERAIVLDNGKFYAELPPGVLDISKVPIKGIIEIIWVSMNQTKLRWGVGSVLTTDSVTVGAFGSLFLQIADATKFVMGLVYGQQIYTEDKIEEWVKSLIAGVMRQEMARKDVRSLQVEREAFVETCRAALGPMFIEWGLEFKHIEMQELTIPPEFRQALQSVTMAGINRQTAVLQASADADVLQIGAQAEANKRLMLGGADVQVMALMQAHGLDPIKMETIRVLLEYAKNQGGGGSGALISGDLYKPQVFAQLSQVLLDPAVPPEVKQNLRQAYPQHAASVPNPIALIAAGTTGEHAADSPTHLAAQQVTTQSGEATQTVERIHQTLDNLDMQLADGKLSEATYNRLREKWQTKLQQLQGGSTPAES
jgi:regulator of protease activity HflC (stomatin/prohibitin superfamily)